MLVTAGGGWGLKQVLPELVDVPRLSTGHETLAIKWAVARNLGEFTFNEQTTAFQFVLKIFFKQNSIF